MADVDEVRRKVLVDFGRYQMAQNPPGIGSECTHWIYAALFEARALDEDDTLNIHQATDPYTWGKKIEIEDARPGDIIQFSKNEAAFFLYTVSALSSSWSSSFQKRGPLHTAMLTVPTSNGVFSAMELHVNNSMRVQEHKIFYQSFAIALTEEELKKTVGSRKWPRNLLDPKKQAREMIQMIDWAAMRDDNEIAPEKADKLRDAVTKGPIKTDRGEEIACLFIVHVSGDIQAFVPQASEARLKMNESELKQEKAKIIKSERVGTKPGHFDWSFPRPK